MEKEFVAQTPKFSLEIKQTAKGLFYVGSLKVNAESLEELDRLFDQALSQVRLKMSHINKNLPEDVSGETENFDSEFDVELFDFLKNLRLEISKNQNVPPYVVFHDSVLIQFAKNKPKTKSDMLRISGVGERNYEKYGDIFLKSIKHFMLESGEKN